MAEEPIIIICRLDKNIKILPQGWNLISKIKHPEIAASFDDLVHTIQNPELIIQSKHATMVYIYYRKTGKYYFSAVIKHLNGDGFLITAYLTSKPKEGKVIYNEKK